MRKNTLKELTFAAMLGGAYAALTMLLPIPQYAGVQFRLAEALTLLPFLIPAATPGLFVGCLIANLYTGMLTDIIFGSLATLLAAVGTYALRSKPLLAAACPVLSNGVIVGLVLAKSFNLPVLLTMGEVALGEVGAVLIGFVILSAIKRAKIDFSRLS